MTEILTAASAVLGVPLTDAVPLAGSDRSSVVRCRVPAGTCPANSVVVKSYPAGEEGAAGFAAEAAGLSFTAGSGTGPELLAADPAARLIVMSDLGDAPSLATLLLGSSAAEARAGLLDWSVACGRLAAGTAARAGEFAALLAGFQDGLRHIDSRVSPPERHWMLRRIWLVPRLLGDLAIDIPAGLQSDLAAVATLLGAAGRHVTAGECQVFSPGDICPDNNLVTTQGIRFIDFESAEFHSVFLDAAYLRMPFSSCWCVFRLPADLARQAEHAYRGLVREVYQELADDHAWQRGMRLAMTAWTLHATTHLLDSSIIADGSMHSRESRAPMARQLLRYRWLSLLAELEPSGDLPAISALMRQLLTSTESWQAAELPYYPAFRS